MDEGWNYHVITIVYEDEPKVYDLSMQKDHLGVGFNEYFNKMFGEDNSMQICMSTFRYDERYMMEINSSEMQSVYSFIDDNYDLES